MANKMRKFLAWVMVLTLLAGQLALPAAAETAEDPTATVDVTVDVSQALPEEPAAEPQAPAPSDTVTVTTSEPVTTVTPDPAAGVIEESTSSTTEWSGSEGGTTTSGSETTTTVTGTDDYTGQTLYQGGATAGSEVSVTTTPAEVVETRTEEGNVDKEIITSITSTGTSEETASTTGETSSTETGEWTNVQEEPVEGEFKATKTEKNSSTTDTIILGEEVLPEGGVDIDLTLNEEASDPENGRYTFTGTGTGAVIDLENIPEGATLVKDEDGNVIGYTLSSTEEKITDTTVINGAEQKDEANSSTDTTGTTSAVTPDLDTAAQKLNIRIDDKSQITEETDETGKVTAYVVTNTTETEEKYDAYDELPIPEAGVFQQTDGSTITRTVEESQDDQGNKVLKITMVQTDKNGGEMTRTETTQTIINSAPMEPADPVTHYVLPTRPEPSTKTENGVTTAVTVTDILDAEGNVIGYKSTTVKTDESGAELYREENDLYGTGETITESVSVANPQTSGTRTVKTTTVETNRVTAEQTVYEDIAAYTRVNNIVHDMEITNTKEMFQVIDGKLYYIYTGSVTVSEGDEHGDVKLMKPLEILESLFNKNSDLDLESGGGNAKYNSGSNKGQEVNQDKPTEGFKYVGYGIDTALNISKGDESSDVVQFRLKGANGEEYYAMCIDFNTTIQPGHLYDIDDLTNEDYYQQSGALDVASAEKIRIIALNGYWGTADDENSTDDIGSLNEVKNLLTSYLTAQGELDADEIKEIVDSLTPGQALAATQAALWKYGNIDGNKKVNEGNLVPNGYDKTKEWVQDNWGRWHEKEVFVKNEDYINTEHVYNALLDLANDPDTTLEEDEGVEFLDAEDITATSIVVKEKVASAGENGNTANVYNTDLNFTLGIEPTKLFGDLKVTVYDNEGNAIKTVVLATKDNTVIGLKPDTNGMYTIQDIKIAEGVSVNLNLYGTQDLGTGVYIYTSLNDGRTDSQTLVTLATGSRKVDLDIEMRLDVQEPTAEKTTTTETTYGKRTDTQQQTRTDKTTRKSTTTTNDRTVEETDKTESEKIYTSDVTLTQIKTTETKSERNWKFSWIKFFDPEPQEQDDDIPVGPPPKDDPVETSDDGPGYEPPAPRRVNLKKTMTIEDELVPLAKAPKTGDLSAIWLAVSGLSLSGVALLNKKRKDEEE